MVAVWRCGHLKLTCTREFGSAQRSVDTIDVHWIRIESHWAIRLLNWFESGFSVDAHLGMKNRSFDWFMVYSELVAA